MCFVNKEGKVTESFLELWKLKGFDAKSITEATEELMQSQTLGGLLCVAQAYVLCYTCKAVPAASEFFELLETVYITFSTSLVNHNKFLEVQRELGLTPSELVELSTT